MFKLIMVSVAVVMWIAWAARTSYLEEKAEAEVRKEFEAWREQHPEVSKAEAEQRLRRRIRHAKDRIRYC